MNLKSFFSLPRRPRGCGGFTLMELLFVLLVIALVLSFALPAYRSVRYDMRNSSAKAALRKLAEARRSFYQYSKGADVTGEIDTDLVRQYAGQGCVSGAASGVPAAPGIPLGWGSCLLANFWIGRILPNCRMCLPFATAAPLPPDRSALSWGRGFMRWLRRRRQPAINTPIRKTAPCIICISAKICWSKIPWNRRMQCVGF